ncbi:hypothetical protein M5K25_019907 [Dendrobium thyrsiflorum]|uniref:Uncharacterized protein n=1 Tax=Dendrobium thyrsiflorum TaxID=117978 RepID=A0ABD0UGM8_DENTH
MVIGIRKEVSAWEVVSSHCLSDVSDNSQREHLLCIAKGETHMHGHCVAECYRLHPNLRKGNEKSAPVLPAGAPLDVQANQLGDELGVLLPETSQGTIPNSDKLNNSRNPPHVSHNSVVDVSRLFKGSDNLAKDYCNVNADELMVITTDYNHNFSSPIFSFPDRDLLVHKNVSRSNKLIAVGTTPEKLLADQGATLQDGVEQTGYASGLINGALDPIGFLDPGAKSVVLEEGELDQGILVVDMPISNEQSGMLHDNNLFVNDHYLTDAFTDNEEVDGQDNRFARLDYVSNYSKGRSRRGRRLKPLVLQSPRTTRSHTSH